MWGGGGGGVQVNPLSPLGDSSHPLYDINIIIIFVFE